jgi:hypothetical protein
MAGEAFSIQQSAIGIQDAGETAECPEGWLPNAEAAQR